MALILFNFQKNLKMKSIFVLIVLLTGITSFAQSKNFKQEELNINIHVDGTLLTPNAVKNPNLAVIIPGSGPTNRDGNQSFIKNNSLKKLAESLSDMGIATFRYDKRVVKQIKEGNIDKNIMFDDFVTDAISVVDYFKSKKEFNKIIIIGHSQGSLVGMMASKENVDGFVSLAGAGQTIDKIIAEQIAKTAPMFMEDTNRVLKSLKQGDTTSDFPQALASLFRLDIQPFLMNWMQYDPQEIIKEIKIPILIINGTKDIQASENEAKLLKEANKNAELVIIKKMNHVLVPIEGDSLENTKSYNEPLRELSKELIASIISFIK